MNCYWTLESWGDGYPPENADEIIERANDLIDAYAENHDEEEVSEYSNGLWERYCSTGRID